MPETAFSPQSSPEIEPQPHSDYELLVAHRRTDGSMKSSEELHTQYVSLTDELIRQMTEGVRVTNHETGEEEVKKPDYVIWLDKSARPVSWLTKELWPTLAADEDGNVPELPEFRFLNIDREQWINTIDPHGQGAVDIDHVDQSIIRSLRSIFVDGKELTHGLTPEIDRRPTELDDKTVLVVDEVYSSGRTLTIAEKFMKRAFPRADIATSHWMKGVIQKGSATGNADLPVWYQENSQLGRGVANRDERRSRQSNSARQRLGAWFLSTTLPGFDPKSAQLRKEMVQLGQDVREHKVLVVPSIKRDEKDFDSRAVRLNGFDDFDEFKLAKRQLTPPKEDPRRPR
ncbi:MAG TPA: hypothetical protein VLF39_04090 [Candidatus Saccharimonadales bacterium]|nr:hypothetical protein [Candidatus Saccharimonadales bacterium]